jgi:putative protein-disulfide isomerase
MQPILIYCYDAWCGWCYGFSSVMQQLQQKYAERLPIEVISGGMILPEKPIPVKMMAPFILEHYPKVEAVTGVRFGADFLWHMKNPDQSDWFPSSEKSAVALAIFKTYLPERQLDFAADLQHALFVEGRDLTDDEAYRHLLVKYGIDEIAFYEQMRQVSFLQKAREEFELCKKLQATGFPQLMLRVSENKIFLITRGYADYASVELKIEPILSSLLN